MTYENLALPLSSGYCLSYRPTDGFVNKSTVFRDITPFSPLKINQHFGGTAMLATRFHAVFLVGLFFDRENGGDMFLRNIG
jgi:hypothetical protein